MDFDLKFPTLPCASCGKPVPVMLRTYRVHCGVCISMSKGRMTECAQCKKSIYLCNHSLCFWCNQTDCVNPAPFSSRDN